MGNYVVAPYTCRIPGVVSPGTEVVISGNVLPNCSSFNINLCMGATHEQGCALHFRPRLDIMKVERNHMQGGVLGHGETNGICPFQKGAGFVIRIYVQKRVYKIDVDNKHFCDFEHRMPHENVRYIYIEGDVSIKYIEFKECRSYPCGPAIIEIPGYPPHPGDNSGSRENREIARCSTPIIKGGDLPPPYSSNGRIIYTGPVPFTSPIPGGLYPGRIIYIAGNPNPCPSRFTVNLQCGPLESADFAMHFDVRFNYDNDRNKVIVTHKQNDKYGREERGGGYFPFHPNIDFEIMILADSSCFKIAVNHQHFVAFNHRLKLESVDHISVIRDVRLNHVLVSHR